MSPNGGLTGDYGGEMPCSHCEKHKEDAKLQAALRVAADKEARRLTGKCLRLVKLLERAKDDTPDSLRWEIVEAIQDGVR